MTPEIDTGIQTAAEATEAPAPQLVPSDYATGFVAGYLRAQGITARPPTVPEFREALAELSEHLAEIRHHAH